MLTIWFKVFIISFQYQQNLHFKHFFTFKESTDKLTKFIALCLRIVNKYCLQRNTIISKLIHVWNNQNTKNIESNQFS